MPKLKIDYILKGIILFLSLLLVVFIIWQPFSRECMTDMEAKKLKAELDILNKIVIQPGNPTDNPNNLMNKQNQKDAQLNAIKNKIQAFCNTNDLNSELDSKLYQRSYFSYCSNGKVSNSHQYGPGTYNISVPSYAETISFILVGGGGGGGTGGWGPRWGNGIGGGGGGQGAILIMSRVPISSSDTTITLNVGYGGEGGKHTDYRNTLNGPDSGKIGGDTKLVISGGTFTAGGGYGGIAGIPTDQRNIVYPPRDIHLDTMWGDGDGGEGYLAWSYYYYGVGGKMGGISMNSSYNQYVNLQRGGLDEGKGETADNKRWEGDRGSMPGSKGGQGGPITPYTITGSTDIPIWATVLGKYGTPWPSDNYGRPYRRDQTSFYQGVGGGPGAGGGGGGGSIHDLDGGDFGANGQDGFAYLQFF